MLRLILLIDGTCIVAKDRQQLCRGGIANAYSELVWQGVAPEEVATAFRWFIENGHDVAYFGVNKTCIFTKLLVEKKQKAVA